MVQTEAQYKFVYLALQRHIQAEKLRLREQRRPPEEPSYRNVGLGSADAGCNAAPVSSRAPAATPEAPGGDSENLRGPAR